MLRAKSWFAVGQEDEVEKGRRKRRRRGNYYLTKSMSREERAELRRADEMEGLADEIAMLRMQLKKAMEEEEDLEMLSLGLERLSRAIGIQHKMSPKKDKVEELLQNLEELMRPYDDIFRPPDN
jgi:iron-sulfur cluster repair protein YtfE (RIC family)